MQGLPRVEKTVLVGIGAVVQSVPVFVPRIKVDLSHGRAGEQQAHLTITHKRRVTPVDGRNEHVFAVHDDPFVVQLGDVIITAHHDG